MTNNTFDFIGGSSGKWKVTSMNTVCGLSLETISHIDILPSLANNLNKGIWTLTGFTSNVRYAKKSEREKLIAVQSDLGRSLATCAALIPIRKTETWWAMAQDERRAIFETKSHHTEIGLKYLPAIARKLYHCRDIGQPFDFLTWFEYAPEDSKAFEELVTSLRNTKEWAYVEREIDIRLKKVEVK
ncbi:MAG: chlorite dismutase family protein [Saprospiraceae bacterium]